MLKIFQEWPFIQDMFFTIYQCSGISTNKHCWCQEYSMEYLAKCHLVENYFQQYTNLVDDSISLVIAIIQFQIFKNLVTT
jgi:hypothetical protein